MNDEFWRLPPPYHCQWTCFSSGSDVELELEDEHKYLPTNLFQDKNEDQHVKLCATTSLTVKYWENANKVSRQAVRKNLVIQSGSRLFHVVSQIGPAGFAFKRPEQMGNIETRRRQKTSTGSFQASSMESAGSRDSLATSEDYESSLALSNMTEMKNNLEFAIKSLTIDKPISRKY